jgi:hypothetical protein
MERKKLAKLGRRSREAEQLAEAERQRAEKEQQCAELSK